MKWIFMNIIEFKNNIIKLITKIINVALLISSCSIRYSFLKITYHYMPGLPSITKEKDLSAFKKLFSNQNFMPDSLKIYPCMVVRGTKLYKLSKHA